MPHAVLKGNLSAARVHRELEPIMLRTDDGLILKVEDSLLARNEHIALLDAVVIEGATRHFLVEVDNRDDGVTVRLYRLTDPEKTEGVRRLVAEVARAVLALDPEASLVRTNIPGLGEGKP